MPISNLLAAYEGRDQRTRQVQGVCSSKLRPKAFTGLQVSFRAAARAEQIHAGNHARVLRHLGGDARAEIHPVRVRSTLENLRVALSGEQREIDSLYPAFLEHANSRLNTTAARSFKWAIESEKSHAKLYSEAVKAFETGGITYWTKADQVLYVCTVCGYTAKNYPEADNCPACNFRVGSGLKLFVSAANLRRCRWIQ